MKKIIHYCWFGNKKMEDYTIACIKSWQEHFPNYQIMVWNENNFDVNICDYTKEAYEAKQYAFVSDYVRLYALYNYGGIYFDTDYEVFKNFEDLLTADLTLGFESIGKVQTAMMFSKKSNPNLLHLINYYNNIATLSKTFCDKLSKYVMVVLMSRCPNTALIVSRETSLPCNVIAIV